jgi:NAD(P)H-dependent flavin oxidoreductase YrpB (nitropropane dioxygenase family)
VTPLHDLLRQIRAAFPGTPLLAAGGIADRFDVATAQAAGASGVWVGTRFVCAAEADAADVYQQMIIDAGAADTVMTTLFSRGWPDAPHRVLRNSTLRAAEENGQDPGALFTDIVARTERGSPIERYAFALPTKRMTGQLEAMALYAGKSVARIHDVRPARDIVRDLAAAM